MVEAHLSFTLMRLFLFQTDLRETNYVHAQRRHVLHSDDNQLRLCHIT